MSPHTILCAADESDVVRAIRCAHERGVAIAVRTGGHHYSGKSSTGGDNIQLDMSGFRKLSWDRGRNLLTLGVGSRIKDISAFMKRERIFVPRGACAYVTLGGHMQTGGYSAIPRAFGLFADHIERFTLYLADGTVRTPARDSRDADDRDLFWAVIGGSPGSFGVITDVTIRPRHDADHPYARAFGGFFHYDRDLLLRLSECICELSDASDAYPGDFDFTILPVGADHQRGLYGRGFPGNLDERRDHPLSLLAQVLLRRPAGIVVLAHWANLSGRREPYDPNNEVFAKVKRACRGGRLFWPYPGNLTDEAPRPISDTLGRWTLPVRREYDLPFIKRNFVTRSRSLVANGFPRWFTDKTDQLHETQGKPAMRPHNHFGNQLAWLGGKDSGFRGSDGRTATAWRDSEMNCVMETFYDVDAGGAKAQTDAREWAQECEREAVNPENGVFTREDRRLLWGPYGNPDLDAMRDCYHESAAYARLLQIKRRVDPTHIFSATPFGVGGSQRLHGHAHASANDNDKDNAHGPPSEGVDAAKRVG